MLWLSNILGKVFVSQKFEVSLYGFVFLLSGFLSGFHGSEFFGLMSFGLDFLLLLFSLELTERRFGSFHSNQNKKNGKLEDNFICLPDPEDVYTWYYIIWFNEAPFKGGYYMGKIKCPENYPANAPQINLLTHNGRFSLQEDGICLSISSFHPESWNPAWKVSQIVVGLSMFWLTDEDTYGAVYEDEYPKDMPWADRRMQWAMESREQVMSHDKFKQIFEPYASAIGIDKEQNLPEWHPVKELIAKKAAEKEAKRL
jgi:ubiquitin-protein ligase